MSTSNFDSEFPKHPNFHIVSAFFTGFVFWGSLCDLFRSPFARYIRRRIFNGITAWWTRHQSRRVTQSESDKEAQLPFAHDGRKRTSSNESIFRRQDNPTLIFILTLLFFMASLSQLASSLLFTVRFDRNRLGSSNDQAFCAFLIAWDSMSFQAARLIGLTVLGLNLRSLGVRRMEAMVFWIVVGVIAVLIIVSNGLGFGILKPLNPTNMMFDVSQGKTMALCYRRHKLGPSLALSLIAIGQEIYCIVRFLDIIAPPSFPLQRRLNTLFRDIRIIRAFSLLIFDLIILVPNAIQTTYLGDSLPFSIAALIVLATFNNYHPSLPLFHEVALQSSKEGGQPVADRTQSVQYKALVAKPHPYSAAALAASASQVNVNRPEGYSGFTTTSGSERALLHQAVRSNAYGPPKKLAFERPELPPVPPEKPAYYVAKLRSSSKPRSRPGSRRTQTSNRSQKSPLVRPIVPKAELARQFNDSEQKPHSHFGHVLGPRPHALTHKRSQSSPIRSPPPATLRSNKSETRRRYSAAASTAKTFTSVSIHYGSDVLRPQPGRAVRDRMRMQADTRVPSPTRASMRTHVTEASRSAVSVSERSPSCDSWLSDQILDASAVAKLVAPVPSLPTFKGGWPMPPSSIPTVGALKDRQRRPGLPSHPAPSGRVKPVALTIELNSTSKPGQSLPTTQRPRPVRSPRGPRMQFPPPRTKASQRR